MPAQRRFSEAFSVFFHHSITEEKTQESSSQAEVMSAAAAAARPPQQPQPSPVPWRLFLSAMQRTRSNDSVPASTPIVSACIILSSSHDIIRFFKPSPCPLDRPLWRLASLLNRQSIPLSPCNHRNDSCVPLRPRCHHLLPPAAHLRQHHGSVLRRRLSPGVRVQRVQHSAPNCIIAFCFKRYVDAGTAPGPPSCQTLSFKPSKLRLSRCSPPPATYYSFTTAIRFTLAHCPRF